MLASYHSEPPRHQERPYSASSPAHKERLRAPPSRLRLPPGRMIWTTTTVKLQRARSGARYDNAPLKTIGSPRPLASIAVVCWDSGVAKTAAVGAPAPTEPGESYAGRV